MKLFSSGMQSINPTQKYLDITQSYACTFKIFVSMFLLPINFLISFGICSTPKLPKYVTLLFSTYKAIQ